MAQIPTGTHFEHAATWLDPVAQWKLLDWVNDPLYAEYEALRGDDRAAAWLTQYPVLGPCQPPRNVIDVVTGDQLVLIEVEPRDDE